MGADKLRDNFNAFMGALLKAKPSTSKGNYLRAVTLSSTMGPGVRIDTARLKRDVDLTPRGLVLLARGP